MSGKCETKMTIFLTFYLAVSFRRNTTREQLIESLVRIVFRCCKNEVAKRDFLMDRAGINGEQVHVSVPLVTLVNFISLP